MQVLFFYQSVASAGNDFTAVVGGSVDLADGQAQAVIPVTIIGDSIPELNESLTVTLTDTFLVPIPLLPGQMPPVGEPILGNIIESSLTILENDAPRGVFTISGTDRSSVVRVTEPDSFTFGLSLQVTRERGDIGQVSVRWGVSGGSAEAANDFIGNYRCILRNCYIKWNRRPEICL